MTMTSEAFCGPKAGLAEIIRELKDPISGIVGRRKDILCNKRTYCAASGCSVASIKRGRTRDLLN